MARNDRNRIKEIVNSFEIVGQFNRIKTMAMGRNNYMVIVSINIDDFCKGYNVEGSVEQMKLEIQNEFPQVNEIYIEISEN
jgi:divalent metal cation (Fe/Co/Zn/Cd) transporter